MNDYLIININFVKGQLHTPPTPTKLIQEMVSFSDSQQPLQ